MDLLFIADPLEHFKTYKDTTFSMMREAQRRGHRIAACGPQDLHWRSGGVVQARVRPIQLTGRTPDWFAEEPAQERALKDFAPC
jgi:glutathione synthase